MRDEKITCDTCGRDLTYTYNCVDYRLVVKSEPLNDDPSWSGPVTAMMVYPPVDRAYHFCGLGCLRSHHIASPAPVVAGGRGDTT